jgi:hypothetical protein
VGTFGLSVRSWVPVPLVSDVLALFLEPGSEGRS